MAMRRSLLPDMGLLQTFEAAARHSNFSRAGEELNLTQSAISRQIRDLEEQLGVALFERIRKRVVLTRGGEAILPEVRALLVGGERLILGARQAQAQVQRLRIATLPTFATRWLVPRLGAFVAAHPDLDLTLESRDGPFDLRAEGVDLAIHYGQPVWPGGAATFLCTERVVPVARRDLAARYATLPEDTPLLHLTGRPGLWAEWFTRYGREGGDPFRGLHFDQFSMVISGVEAGLGVGLLPLYMIEAELAGGKLVRLSEQAMPTEKSYYVILPEGEQGNQAARAFQTWLLQQPGSALPLLNL